MKFGKQLELSANAEWRDQYVQYKRLKRLIKRVAFEVEKHSRKQEKIISQSPDLSVRVQVDETHPLLRSAVNEVEAAKEEFWEVTGQNLKVVNDFYVGKIVSLTKAIKDFEDAMQDEQTSHGHVHARSRTFSQGIKVVLCKLVQGRTV